MEKKMNKNSQGLYNILEELYQKMLKNDFVIDKSGSKLLQKMTAMYKIDPTEGHHLKIVNPITDYVFAETNQQYIELETKWHESMELNINMVSSVKIWKQVSSNNDQINSNYGWCVFHPDNGSDGKSQFEHVLQTLNRHKQSRQALIIYTRPTMHTDSKRDGMSDFLCTISNQFLIRNNKLEMIYMMKGQDITTGTKTNVAWAIYVYNKMLEKLKETYPELETGTITFMVGSLHVYERHFKKLRKLFQVQ